MESDWVGEGGKREEVELKSRFGLLKERTCRALYLGLSGGVITSVSEIVMRGCIVGPRGEGLNGGAGVQSLLLEVDNDISGAGKKGTTTPGDTSTLYGSGFGGEVFSATTSITMGAGDVTGVDRVTSLLRA